VEGNYYKMELSTIKKLDMKKESVQSIIMFDRGLKGSDLGFLEEEFDFNKELMSKFVANYKNVGIVFKLNEMQEETSKEWGVFIDRVIRKSSGLSAFDNIFVGKKYDSILLVTNKRLLKLDLGKLNNKIEDINYRIDGFNNKASEEMEKVAEGKGFFSKIVEVLRK
jgi:hypothetical protein